MTQREKILHKRIDDLRARLADAEKRGEPESYLALYRFQLEELQAALPAGKGAAR
jgi:hypothetical protein